MTCSIRLCEYHIINAASDAYVNITLWFMLSAKTKNVEQTNL